MGKEQATTPAVNGMENVENLSKEQREQIVSEMIQRQKEKFEKRLAERAKRLEEKLKDKADKDRILIVKRVNLQMLKAEIKDKKVMAKQLRAEIKAIKQLNRSKEKGVVVQKAAVKTA